MTPPFCRRFPGQPKNVQVRLLSSRGKKKKRSSEKEDDEGQGTTMKGKEEGVYDLQITRAFLLDPHCTAMQSLVSMVTVDRKKDKE